MHLLSSIVRVQPIRRSGTLRLTPRQMSTAQMDGTAFSIRSWCAIAASSRARVDADFATLAYNLGNFLRTLATPEPIKDWSLTSLKEKLIKIGSKVISHGRYVAFQMAEIAIPRIIFADILRLIAELRPPPATSTA
jgi:Transposase DDE domain group 1